MGEIKKRCDKCLHGKFELTKKGAPRKNTPGRCLASGQPQCTIRGLKDRPFYRAVWPGPDDGNICGCYSLND